MAVDRRIVKSHNPLEEADKTNKLVGRSAVLFEQRIRHEQIRSIDTALIYSVFKPYPTNVENRVSS